MKANAEAKHPGSELAQWIPSLVYIGVATNGRTAATIGPCSTSCYLCRCRSLLIRIRQIVQHRTEDEQVAETKAYTSHHRQSRGDEF